MPPAITPNPTYDEGLLPAEIPAITEACGWSGTPEQVASACCFKLFGMPRPQPRAWPQGAMTTGSQSARTIVTRNATSSTSPKPAAATKNPGPSSRPQFMEEITTENPWRIPSSSCRTPINQHTWRGLGTAPYLLRPPSGSCGCTPFSRQVAFLWRQRSWEGVRLVGAALACCAALTTPIRLLSRMSTPFHALMQPNCLASPGCPPKAANLAVASLGGRTYDSRDSFSLPQPRAR